jgi:hypothetical protein
MHINEFEELISYVNGSCEAAMKEHGDRLFKEVRDRLGSEWRPHGEGEDFSEREAAVLKEAFSEGVSVALMVVMQYHSHKCRFFADFIDELPDELTLN